MEQLAFDLTLKNLLTVSEPHFSNGCEKTACPVGLLGGLKVSTECLGQGLSSWRSVVAVVLMFVLKINSSIRISKSQSCLWKHTLCRPRHLHGCSDWAFTGEVFNQAGDGEQLPCAPAACSLMGGRCFVLVYLTFRAQVGVRRLEVGPWRREFLRRIERDSEEGWLL